MANFKAIEEQIKQLSNADKSFMSIVGSGTLRKFMSSDEISKANRLVKLGMMLKGISDEKNGTIMYHVDSSILSRI